LYSPKAESKISKHDTKKRTLEKTLLFRTFLVKLKPHVGGSEGELTPCFLTAKAMVK